MLQKVSVSRGLSILAAVAVVLAVCAKPTLGQQQEAQQLIVTEQLTQLLEPSETDAVIPLSNSEKEAIKECMRRIHRGLSPDVGDNLLAAAWDIEDGEILHLTNAITPRQSVAKRITFDSTQTDFKQWFQDSTMLIDREDWLRAEIVHAEIDDEQFLVDISAEGLRVYTTLIFEERGQRMQLVGIHFRRVGC